MIDLGSMYTKIEADTKGLRKAEAAIRGFASSSIKVIGGVSVAVTAAVTAGGLLIKTAAAEARELQNLANVAGTSASEFQALSFATETVGINAEKLSDISKDVQDKLGDFIATGGGEFKDFFEEVATKVGLTAEALKGLSGPDVLVAVKKALDDANVSAKEQVFYMEAIANDASYLSPLLADNGKKLKEYSDRARELGGVLSELEISRLVEASTASKEFGTVFSAMTKKVAAGLAPLYTLITNKLTVAIQDFNKEFSSNDILIWATESSIAVLQFSSTAIDGFEGVYRFVNNVTGTLSLATAGALKLGQGFQWLFEQSNRLLGDTKKADDWAKSQQDAARLIDESLASAVDSFDKADKENKFFDNTKTKISALTESLKAFKKDVEKETDFSIGIGTPADSGALEQELKEIGGTWVNVAKETGDKVKQTNNIVYDDMREGFNEAVKDMEKDAQEGVNNIMAEINRLRDDVDIKVNVSSQAQKDGGFVKAMKDGGAVLKAQAGRFFPGFGGGDKIPIMGEAGEYMINKFSVRKAGVDTARAFNKGDFKTVVSNLAQKMSLGGPTSPRFSMPAMALAGGGSVANNQTVETPRNYYIQGNSTPISMRADNANASKMLSVLRGAYMSKRV